MAPLSLQLLPLLLGSVVAGSLRYDQAQTGDTNIHLQIKNVEVLALLEDISPGEYDYDYNDFTEKPHKPLKPNNSSASSNATAGSSPFPPVEASNITSVGAPVDSPPAPSDTSPAEHEATASEEPLLGPTTPASAPEVPAAPEAPQSAKKTRRCGSGFYRDTLGRCRRIRRPHLQMLVNLGRKRPTESPTES